MANITSADNGKKTRFYDAHDADCFASANANTANPTKKQAVESN